MSLVEEAKKYEFVIDNYKKTIHFLIDKLFNDTLSKHYDVYLKIFNMLTGGNFTREDFIFSKGE